ncbi:MULTISPECIES: sarcosine oxidase subunit gamma [unclassified Acidisoma]|uniref:sarcosine oxidase subunit gamma n=1 Tax=unclassified Acidisoma TaxID=2634065 RepID=UPI001C20704B|nr:MULTISPECIES: sarcosine oxidase subunit gamma family protein [unclassified Acidisoma]
MVEIGLLSRSPLAAVLQPGHYGQPGQDGLVVQERTGLHIVNLAARRGQGGALAVAVQRSWGLELPTTPRRAGDGRLAFLWSGGAQWLAIAEGTGDLELSLKDRLGSLASLTDQSDGRSVLRLSGSRTRETLAKGLAIDLHPRAFTPGDTALTLAGHIGVQIWQLDDTPSYEIAVARGYAGSLIGWLLPAGEEFGITVLPPG